jgi:ankyrin repeat protein
VKGGHDSVVKLMLETGKVDVDSTGLCDQTLLVWAAGNGYDAVVNVLLTKYGIDTNLKDSKYGRMPLSWATKGGHEAVVKLLLEIGKVKVDSKDECE